jgi:hypothetical protein
MRRMVFKTVAIVNEIDPTKRSGDMRGSTEKQAAQLDVPIGRRVKASSLSDSCRAARRQASATKLDASWLTNACYFLDS